MYAPERYRSIVERVVGMGRASVTDLADDLDVTPETIRRDLSELERQGLVRRVHGGAVPTGRVGFEASVDSRNATQVEEKARIARAVLAEIPTEGAVIMDAGTTTGRIISLLPDDREITLVTDSVEHAVLAAGRSNVNVMILGGRVRGRTLACVDQWALDALNTIYADVAILGANGVSLEKGLTTPDQAEATIKKAMLQSARRKVIVADHTKFNNDHFATFGDVSEIDAIYTDRLVDDETAQQYIDAGVEVVRS